MFYRLLQLLVHWFVSYAGLVSMYFRIFIKFLEGEFLTTVNGVDFGIHLDLGRK